MMYFVISFKKSKYIYYNTNYRITILFDKLFISSSVFYFICWIGQAAKFVNRQSTIGLHIVFLWINKVNFE